MFIALLKREDLRALTPLIYSHVTPYGTFRLDLSDRLILLVRLAYASYPLLIEAHYQVGSDLRLIFEHKMA
jgi:hypothetical protein